MNWIDNADSYVCPNCGFECNNPNKLKSGPNQCPKCKQFFTERSDSKCNPNYTVTVFGHEVDPCVYEEIETHHNCTVHVLRCKQCGHIEIEWEKEKCSSNE